MSQYVKNLIADDLKLRLDGVDAAILVNVIGMEANANTALRHALHDKGISLLVVKNSLARRATEGTVLGAAFEGKKEGSLAIVWGAEDVVSLAKEITRLAADEQFKKLETRGGVMDGKALTADEVQAVSKWPNREEQLSILSGQLLSPGAELVGQLLGPAKQLASQIKQKSEGDE